MYKNLIGKTKDIGNCRWVKFTSDTSRFAQYKTKRVENATVYVLYNCNYPTQATQKDNNKNEKQKLLSYQRMKLHYPI